MKQPDLRQPLREAKGAEAPASGQDGGPEQEDHYLPPRNTVHATEKEKWLPIFYRSLLWIFILLVIGLLAWGWKLFRT